LVWMHCASLGEYDQGKPIFDKLRKDYPNYAFAISFFSASGYDNVDREAAADFVCYLPFDFPKKVRAFIDLLDPVLALVVKNEVWPNSFVHLHRKGIPLVMIAALFRADQAYFTWYGGIYSKALNSVKCFLVQNKSSAKLLKERGFNNTIVTGDPRFDRVAERLLQLRTFPQVESYVRDRKAVVAGSAWIEEVQACVGWWEEQAGKQALVLVPHEIDEAHLAAIEGIASGKMLRYSEVSGEIATDKILLVDQIGLLSHLYQYADVAVVGGAFGKGLHNILEPLVLGKPVVFGANFKRFPEALEALDQGCAYASVSVEDMQKQLNVLMEDSFQLEAPSQAAVDWVASQEGATMRSLKWLAEHANLEKEKN